MSLSFQPTVKSSQVDGLSAQSQSKDSETSQPLSFGDVLKVEEKKLQQEQETSALSVAAVLATLPLPAVTQPIPGLNPDNRNGTIQSPAQTSPAVASVRSAATPLQQSPSLNSQPVAAQQTTLTENVTAKTNTQVSSTNSNNATSAKKIIEPVGQSAENKTFATISTANNKSLPATTQTINIENNATINQAPAKVNNTPVKLDQTKLAVESNTANKQQTSSTPIVQITRPESKGVENSTITASLLETPQKQNDPRAIPSTVSVGETTNPPNVTNISTAKAAPLDAINQSEYVSPIVDNESLTNQKTVIVDKKSFEPVQTNGAEIKTPQPAKKTTTSNTKLVSQNPANTPTVADNKIETSQKTSIEEIKPVVPTQINEPAIGFLQSVEKINSPVAEVASLESSDQNKNAPDGVDSQIVSNQRTLVAEMKLAEPVQMSLHTAEVQESVEMVNTPIANAGFSGPYVQSKNISSAETKSVASMQMKAAATETPPPAARTNIPAAKAASSEPTSQSESAPVIDNEIKTNQQTLTTETKLVESVPTKAITADVSRTTSKTNVQTAKVVFSEPANQSKMAAVVDSEIKIDQQTSTAETKPTETLQTKVTTAEVSQPAIQIKTPIANADFSKSSVPGKSTPTMFDEAVTIDQKILSMDAEPVEPVRASTPAIEMVYRAEETSSPVVNAVSPDILAQNESASMVVEKEIENDQKIFNTAVTSTKPSQMSVPAGKVPHPTETINIPSMETTSLEAPVQSKSESIIDTVEIKTGHKTFVRDAQSIESNQTKPFAFEVPQSGKAISTEAFIQNEPVTISADNEIKANQKTPLTDNKADELVQSKTNITNAQRPTSIGATKVARSESVTQSENAPVADSRININQKTSATEIKSAEPVQTKAAAVDVPQPAEKIDVPIAEVAFSKNPSQSENAPDVVAHEIRSEQKTLAAEPQSVRPSQTSTPVVDDLQTTNKIDIPVETTVSANVPGQGAGEPIQITIETDQKTFAVETKSTEAVQMNTSASEIREPLNKAKTPIVVTTTLDNITQSENTLVTADNEIELNQKSAVAETKFVEPAQTSSPAMEASQPTEKATPPLAKVISHHPADEVTVADSQMGTNQKTFAAEVKPAESVQTNVPVREPLQATNKLNVSAAKTTLPDDIVQSENASAVVDNKTETSQKISTTEMKPGAPTQTNTTGGEIPQPVNKSNVPTMSVAESVVNDENGNVPIVIDSQNTSSQKVFVVDAKLVEAVQANMADSEIPQSASKTNIPVTKTVTPEIIAKNENVPVATYNEVSANSKTFVVDAKLAEPILTNVTDSELPQPASKTNIPVAKVVTPEIIVKNENESVDTEAKAVEPLQKNVPAVEVSQPANQAEPSKAKVFTSETTAVESALTNMTEVEVSQPMGKNNIRAAKVVTVQDENKPVAGNSEVEVNQQIFAAETKSVEAIQTNAPDVEVLQPVNQSDIPVAKVASAPIGINNQAVTNKKIFAADTISAEPVQTDATDVELPRPVSKPNMPVAEKNVSETKSVDQKPVTQQVAEQREVVNTMPAEVKIFNVKPAVDAQVIEASQPMANPIDQIAAEAILGNKDTQVATSLGEGNAAAESRLEAAGNSKVSNEAFTFVQENAPASIQSKTVAQSTQVEIKQGEKISSKELNRKPALDLASTTGVTGTDKGTVSVKATEKSSVVQIDPTAMDVIQQITSHMKARINSEETSIRMQINPKELGAIEVQMTHTAQGVSVSFITEQPSTGQLLESQVSQLRQSLKDAGVQLTNLNINQHNQPNQQGGSFKQSQAFVQHSQRNAPSAEIVNDEIMRPQRIGGLTSEIDYLI